MKQLLIVNSAKALNAKAGGGSVTPLDLSGLDAGAITFFELGASSVLAASPTKNFGIALGGGVNKMPFLIPEVDYDTVEVNKAVPQNGNVFSASFTVPTTVAGKDYTVIIVKKGAQPHERNTWTATVRAKDTTAANVATALAKELMSFGDGGTISSKPVAGSLSLNIHTTISTATITVAGTVVGEQFAIKFADELMSLNDSVTPTEAKPAIGDKAYIQDLASRCAAGKGFTDVMEFGPSVYPGYPETVEDTTYNVYTLRFQVGRKSSKTRDEKVWQLVHIAVPTGATAATAIDNIITKIKAPAEAANSGGGGAG